MFGHRADIFTKELHSFKNLLLLIIKYKWGLRFTLMLFALNFFAIVIWKNGDLNSNQYNSCFYKNSVFRNNVIGWDFRPLSYSKILNVLPDFFTINIIYEHNFFQNITRNLKIRQKHNRFLKSSQCSRTFFVIISCLDGSRNTWLLFERIRTKQIILADGLAKSEENWKE